MTKKIIVGNYVKVLTRGKFITGRVAAERQDTYEWVYLVNGTWYSEADVSLTEELLDD